jgi:hypothetical protein
MVVKAVIVNQIRDPLGPALSTVECDGQFINGGL